MESQGPRALALVLVAGILVAGCTGASVDPEPIGVFSSGPIESDRGPPPVRAARCGHPRWRAAGPPRPPGRYGAHTTSVPTAPIEVEVGGEASMIELPTIVRDGSTFFEPPTA